MVESRTPAAQSSGVVRFGPFELDLRTGELRKSGLRVSLQDQPLQVLTMLLERRGELVTREELRQRLWPADTFVDFEQGLNAAVKRLRSVLGDSADVPRFIETLPRRGYRWIYPAEPVGQIPVVDQAPVVSPARVRGLSPRTRWLALAAVVLVAGFAAFRWRHGVPPVSETTSRVRVVPLTSLDGVESDPALSPDGKNLAFCWDGDGEPGLYVKRIGDDRQVRLGHSPRGVFSPTWSPDGRDIAYLRHPATGESMDEIVIVPASGGSERRLGTSIGNNHGMDWSPDGRLLAFVGKASAEAPDAIHLLTIETGERRRLTTPGGTANFGDHRPTFSADGQSVAFIRRVDIDSSSTTIHLQQIGSSVSRPVTTGYNVRDVAWHTNGRSLVFVAGRPAEPNLWVVDAPTGTPRRLSGEANVLTVSTTRGGRTLAFEQQTADINVWRAGGPASSRREPPHALLRGPRTDMHPDYSPDGRRIAFASARDFRLGIWTCAQDGNDCVTFKMDGSLIVPRWSFDGQSIAAVGWRDDVPLDIYRLEIAGRFVRRLTTDNAVDTVPTWSRDSRWLYFASNRTGTPEIWKMPSTGGEPRQLTKRGGAIAHETADGRWIYYMNRMPIGSLWKMPAEGGAETLVLDKQIHFGKWALWQGRIIYIDESSRTEHHVVMFDPKTGRSARLVSLEKVSTPGLAVSPDGAWILYSQTDRVVGDILMLEGVE